MFREGWQSERMEFSLQVREIIQLEDEIRTAPEHLIDTEWLEDRVIELRVRYKELLRIWPIEPGCGNMRWTYQLDENKE